MVIEIDSYEVRVGDGYGGDDGDSDALIYVSSLCTAICMSSE